MLLVVSSQNPDATQKGQRSDLLDEGAVCCSWWGFEGLAPRPTSSTT
jgi:hypothetical protein